MLGYIAITFFVLLTDQLVKAWAVASLKPVGTIAVLNGLFGLTYAENTGGAFSILAGQRLFFVVIGAAALAAIGYMWTKDFFATRMSRVAVALLVGGILGNLVDRARQGFVVDMFELQFIRFAVFNIADLALTAGVGLLIIFILAYKETKDENPDAGSRG